ncbi:hypothetical protein Hanom_Chr02g00118491 [Helianthus anomalus]
MNRGRKKQPAAQWVKKTEDPKGKGKEVGESSGQTQTMPPCEELDRKLTNCDLIGPTDETFFNFPAHSERPINLEPPIPDPIVNPQPVT